MESQSELAQQGNDPGKQRFLNMYSSIQWIVLGTVYRGSSSEYSRSNPGLREFTFNPGRGGQEMNVNNGGQRMTSDKEK